jgi:hypothetical protein
MQPNFCTATINSSDTGAGSFDFFALAIDLKQKTNVLKVLLGTEHSNHRLTSQHTCSIVQSRA